MGNLKIKAVINSQSMMVVYMESADGGFSRV